MMEEGASNSAKKELVSITAQLLQRAPLISRCSDLGAMLIRAADVLLGVFFTTVLVTLFERQISSVKHNRPVKAWLAPVFFSGGRPFVSRIHVDHPLSASDKRTNQSPSGSHANAT